MLHRRYRYVDFASRGLPGFRNHVVPVDEVATLVARHGRRECFASIFCFADNILLYLSEHRVAGRPSIAGYDGRVWAPFLPLDLDSAGPAHRLDDVLALTRVIYRLLTERWGVATAAVHVYFSGAKGFHVLLDTRAFGRVRAAADLHRVFSYLRLDVLRALPETARPLFDLAIGDKVRLLRLPNTRHAESGLYKIPLTTDQLFSLGPEGIRDLARTPQPLARVTAGGLLPTERVAPTPRLVEAFARARRALRRERGAHPYRLRHPSNGAEAALCPARLAMWRERTAPGNRNNVAIRLASAFRLGGHHIERTHALLSEWNERCGIGLPQQEITAVVHSAYAHPFPYSYGCHDEVVRAFCPYAGRLVDCPDYRAQHPRSGRALPDR